MDEITLMAERRFQHADPWSGRPETTGPWQVHWETDLPLGPMLIETTMLVENLRHGVQAVTAGWA